MIRTITGLKTPKFSHSAIQILKNGNILQEGETTDEMTLRVLNAVFDIEKIFNTASKEIDYLKSEFAGYLADKLVILGSPTLTNAGRNHQAALSSCVAIPVDLRDPLEQIKPLIEQYYFQNMGSGFNFSKLNDPSQMVRLLNQHAADETTAKKYDRYIGNMGNLDIDHPNVLEFIGLKSRENGIRHFNLSVNVNEIFMNTLFKDEPFTLKSGSKIKPKEIWSSIVKSAWQCGDPGILFLDRFNEDNPTPHLGDFTTTAPCAEVGLAPGESCVFGYINLGQFHRITKEGFSFFDFDLLERVVPSTTRVLDNCLEASLDYYPSTESKMVMGGKRKIGVGVCGFADLLVKMGIPYASDEAVRLLQDILTTISFTSKKESFKLAKQRGSFSGYFLSRYVTEPNFLSKKYMKIAGSRIHIDDWRHLENEIKSHNSLRNATTTALPPSGRSALIVDASTSIEPHFSLKGLSGEIHASIIQYVKFIIKNPIEASRILEHISRSGSCRGIELPSNISTVVKPAIEISPEEQLRIVASTVNCIDEGASKTVNLPYNATHEDVSKIFIMAWNLGLKAISIYRDGSHLSQPERLS